MGLEIRAATSAELDELRQTMGLAFGFDPHAGDERLRHILALERTRCVFDRGRMVATSAAFSLEMTVPGGRVHCGGTSLVSVVPTHRRRGLLRRMMTAHLDEVTERGEPIAALWASDSAIYGRFGYGMASVHYEIEVRRSHVATHRLAPEPAPVRLVELDEAKRLLPGSHDRVGLRIPGFFARSEEWWEHRRFADPDWSREGMTAKRYAVLEGGDGIEGFVQYRSKPGWEDGHGAGRISIGELVAATPRAWAGLWYFVLGHDLTDRIEASLRPTWDPVFDLLAASRRVRATLSDALWVRIMDVSTALASRSYSAPVDLVLAVSDPLDRTSGRYRLWAGDGEVECTWSDAAPDIELDLEDLSAAYMGRARFRRLAAAGRVRGRPEALAAADRAFTWDPQPWCPEVF